MQLLMTWLIIYIYHPYVLLEPQKSNKLAAVRRRKQQPNLNYFQSCPRRLGHGYRSAVDHILGIWHHPGPWFPLCPWHGMVWSCVTATQDTDLPLQVLVTWILKRYNHELQTSEMFSTAGRTVKSGLVASAVVSSWTWAATLLQSSSVAYRYGVSGPFWYASGATVQILLFASIAIELKRRAPNAHTFLEVIKARYGMTTHLVFTVFGLMTNILVTAMLLTGGSAAFNALTGVPTPAACFLLPLGVIIYTMFGGIKATFLTDYVHTVMLLIIILIFAFTTYATSSTLGSPGAVFDLLVNAAMQHPVAGNAGGSYLTMRSQEGAIFL